jgi:plasmid stabilization system protein ParE
VARQLRWSPEALDDIHAIAAYIERQSHWYASTVAARFVRVAENLAQFAEGGRVVPELDEADIREGFVYSYRLIYQVLDDHVMMLTVLHMKQLLAPETVSVRRETQE